MPNTVLCGARITAKYATDWPKTKTLVFETDSRKRLFLESVFTNTNDNVTNSKTMGGLRLCGAPG